MSLSTWLRDYLYVPLGGNRHGPLRRHLNLLLTMLLGGLWHGAAWTFVAWGALHGVYLVVNHLWRGWCAAPSRQWLARLVAPCAWPLTFLAAALAWVLFRADSFARALAVYAGAFGLHGLGDAPFARALRALARKATIAWQGAGDGLVERLAALAEIAALDWGVAGRSASIAAALALAWWAPNTQTLMRFRYLPGQARYVAAECSGWQPRLALTLGAGVLLAMACQRLLTSPATQFLYFEF